MGLCSGCNSAQHWAQEADPGRYNILISIAPEKINHVVFVWPLLWLYKSLGGRVSRAVTKLLANYMLEEGLSASLQELFYIEDGISIIISFLTFSRPSPQVVLQLFSLKLKKASSSVASTSCSC